MRFEEAEERDFHGEGEDHNPLVTTETNGELTRWTYADRSVGWKLRNRFLADYEQDQFEEAYQMGAQCER